MTPLPPLVIIEAILARIRPARGDNGVFLLERSFSVHLRSAVPGVLLTTFLTVVSSVWVATSGAAAAPPSRAAGSPTAPAASTGSPAGTFVPVRPYRAVNTETGAGHNRRGSLKHRHGFTARITDRSGVPANVAAVAVTITAQPTSGSGGLVLYRAGSARPSVSNVLFAAGQSSSATAVVRPSTRGRIAIYNTARAGRVNVIVDVSGYYVAGRASDEQPGVLHPLPQRRAFGRHAIGAHRSLTADVGGRAGVPAAGVGAVAVLVTVQHPAKSGAMIAYQAGAGRPHAPMTSFDRATDTVGFGFVPTDGDGRIALYNNSGGKAYVSVAVLGYTVGGVVTRAGATSVGGAHRILRNTKVRVHAARKIKVAARAGMPKGHVTAVLLDVTATASKAGSVSVFRADGSRPSVPTLTFPAHRARSALAIVRPSPTGWVKIRNNAASGAHVAIDVVGYVAAVNKPVAGPPTPSNSHYIRTKSSQLDLAGIGCDDKMAGSTFVLLDLGAQSMTKRLAGVGGITLSHTTTRLKYSELRQRLLGKGAAYGYLTGFANCANPSVKHATVAIGTNNDGAFSGTNAYPAPARGRRWASFIAGLRQAAPPGITVVGANDIESSFAGTEAQAEAWTKAYLAVDNTGNRVGPLIYNGSADGCPSTLGVVGRSCAYGWTQADYYALTHGLGSRIQALPQVYNAAQPRQWANIDATGGARINFAGSLTEYAACPHVSPDCAGSSVRPRTGWNALRSALATVVDHPRLPAATDLDVDGAAG